MGGSNSRPNRQTPDSNTNTNNEKDNPDSQQTQRSKPKSYFTPTTNKFFETFPITKCLLRLKKLERLYDYLIFEDNLLTHTDHEISQQKSPSPNQTPSKDSQLAHDMLIVEEMRGHPLQLGTLEELFDQNNAIVSSGLGPDYFVSIRSFVDKTLLQPGTTILLNNKDNSVVGVLEGETDPLVSLMKLERAPTETYDDIGGLDSQIREIKESVELPLTSPELFEEMGIKPPKGVILYGLPGTGKTLLAKAVANKTSATFLRIVGSELIQKYLGDGPKLVRELFKLADQNAPSIIFIDEIDAIGTKRNDSSCSGEKEIQRTMLELLNQLDGFDSRNDIKVIMATNKIETLDPALIRPGRIDRKILFELPDAATKKRIFDIHTKKMTLNFDIQIDRLIQAKENLSGADIKAMCSEAGMMALRERRREVCMNDFIKAKEKVLLNKRGDIPPGLYL